MKITRFERIRDRSDNGNNKPVWLVGFTDLITLLLAFFILLFAISQPRKQPWAEVGQSMRASFGGEANVAQSTKDSGAADAKLSWAKQPREPGLQIRYLYSLLRRDLGKVPELAGVRLWLDDDAILISLPTNLTFAAGSDQMSDGGQRLVAKLTPLLLRVPNAIEAIGHTDPSLPNEDKAFSSNWHLSLARALSVAKALQAAGYRKMIDVKGRGSTDMKLLPTDLPDDVLRARARRVDLRLRPLQSEG